MKKLSMILFNIKNQYFIILENKSLDNRVFAKCSPNILNGHHFKFLNIVFRMIKNVICNSCYAKFRSHIVITLLNINCFVKKHINRLLRKTKHYTNILDFTVMLL